MAKTITIMRGEFTTDPVKVMVGEEVVFEERFEPFHPEFNAVKKMLTAIGEALGIQVLETQHEQQRLPLGQTEEEFTAGAIQTFLEDDKVMGDIAPRRTPA